VAINHLQGGGNVGGGGGGGGGGSKAHTSATALLFRRSSNVSLVEPGELRWHRRGRPATASSANGLNFGNYYCAADAPFVNGGGGSGSTIRRCYSSSTAGDGTATTTTPGTSESKLRGTAFVQRIRRDSRRSPRILITRAMSEENESCSSEPGTPVRKDLVHKLSSSTVTLFIDERRKKELTAAAGSNYCSYYDNGEDDDDDDEDCNMSAGYSSLSSSNDDCAADCETRQQCLARFSSA